MNSNNSNATYNVLSKFYDLFDLIFLLGGKGNPRSGLPEALGNASCILDVCVGTAASSIQVATRHRQSQIVGMDISDAMLSVAQKKVARKQLTNIELKTMSADALQFADSSFDGVMVSFALHKIEDELREAIFKEISRVLKSGGKFCVIDFARQRNRSNQVFMKVWTWVEPPCFPAFLDMDWRSRVNAFGLQFESEKEYSFSKIICTVQGLSTCQKTFRPTPRTRSTGRHQGYSGGSQWVFRQFA